MRRSLAPLSLLILMLLTLVLALACPSKPAESGKVLAEPKSAEEAAPVEQTPPPVETLAGQNLDPTPTPEGTGDAGAGGTPAVEGGLTRETVEIENKVAVMVTDEGTIHLFFYPKEAPLHVRNFIYLAEKGFYSDVQFHRVINGFMIQGGQARANWNEPLPMIPNESGRGRTHLKGALAAARTSDLNSATSEFYICLDQQDSLDQMQYTAYGQCFKGQDVVDKIGAAPKNQGDTATPEKTFIKSVTIEDATPYAEEIAAFKTAHGIKD